MSLTASQLEGTRPQLVAGLIAGTTDQYAILKVNADGSLVRPRVQLILDAGSGTQLLVTNTANVLNPAASSDPNGIYDSILGEITIPRAGWYSLSAGVIGALNPAEAGRVMSITPVIDGVYGPSLFGSVDGDGYLRVGGSLDFYVPTAGLIVTINAFPPMLDDITIGGVSGWYVLSVISL